MKIIGISCLNYNRAIGSNNNLLYRIATDMGFFKNTTTKTVDSTKKNAVLMGSNTYLSIPKKFRPLNDRINLIISNKNYNKINNEIKTLNNNSSFLFNNIEQSLQFVKNNNNIENLYIIGGQSIYKHFMDKSYFNELLLTEIIEPKKNIGDTFFPDFTKQFYKINTKSFNEENVLCNTDNTVIPNMSFNINNYVNNKSEQFKFVSDEIQYLDTLKNVLETGEIRKTRNSETISKFGLRMEFDINKKFPLLTTKKVFWKGVKEELLWFLNAKTDSNELKEKGVKIWDGNSTKEYLNSIGLNNYLPGWCGPIYGFQWRHFNANYKGPNENYNNKGIDQLKNCIDLIKKDPTSRRIFMTAWNPCQLDEMALPPCHVSYQFYVSSDNKLHCQMYQRSGDLFLGVPFNIASTALLTSIIAKMTDYEPGKIVVVLGDAHIYKNHIDQIKEQLKRKPYYFPTLDIKQKLDNIEDYTTEDFQIQSYYSHPPIKAEMIA